MGDRLGGWARRFFAPVLASGAALALVGAIGTAGPSLGGLSGPSRTRVSPHSRSRRARQQHRSQRRKPPVAPQPAKVFERLPPTGAAPRRRPAIRPEPARRRPAAGTIARARHRTRDEPSLAFEDGVTAERSPWPMVLFAGVALMVAALLMRWILAPRAP